MILRFDMIGKTSPVEGVSTGLVLFTIYFSNNYIHIRVYPIQVTIGSSPWVGAKETVRRWPGSREK